MKMKTRIQNKETFKRVLFWSSMVICLFLAGCKDKSIDHYNRGVAHHDKGEYDLAISDYTKAIEINPKHAFAYNNRAVAYYFKGEYDKAQEDVHKAQSLGDQVHPGFLKALREASGRDR
jgi:tetratricopeptide (TPR) repeat protein